LSSKRESGDETIETVDDITRKNSTSIPLTIEHNANAEQETDMLKPSFRFFIIPFGAVATLATLSSQNIAPRAQREAGVMPVREQVIDCSIKSAAEVCEIR
jgi:hypothetical protein